MEHTHKCQKCGKKYVVEKESESLQEPTCNTCGAEIYDADTQANSDINGNGEDEHPIEKGLRRVTDEITGDKKKV
ncbi:hypothetical protein HW452_09880 [Halomonas aquamarina]|uniref:Uncharacterized protein n=1 Tax=Vreelandella aquamarina TaxID=77097 RepID=A0ACC5VVV8_9GAMM|nr:hypothetical protein [Halomonas aquamarina]MBZ5487834.1 hypothetical protein [Halomonas aquamarina]